jgi:DNA-binding LacI/PurR family transcriptional regulator
MTTTALRKKLHGYIDAMPEKNLAVIKPLLSALSEPLYTIEPATPEEGRKAEKRIREYHRDPSSFVPFKKRVIG